MNELLITELQIAQIRNAIKIVCVSVCVCM